MTDLNNLDFKESDFSPDNQAMSAKQRLVDFVKKTNSGALEYEFIMPNCVPIDGHNFIQCMRVELSRFRRKIVAQGRKPIEFKMHKKDVLKVENGIKIILVRGEEKPLSSEMEDILNTLSI